MEKEYIYCNIKFTEDSNTYYYITKNKSFKIGDFVLVPTKGGRIDRIGRIEEIQNYSEEKVPFPIEQTKSIIRKALPIEVLEAGWDKKETYTSSNNKILDSILEKSNLKSQNVISKEERKPKPLHSTAKKPKRVQKEKKKRKKKSKIGFVFKFFGAIFAGMVAAGNSKPPRTPRLKRTGYPKGVSYYPKNRNF